MNLALATFSNSYSYAKKLSGLENRKLAKFHLQVVVIAIKGLDCTWPKSPPFSQFLIRLPPLCVFHHFPLFNWVWWWSWIFSVKCRATEFFHDLWPPTDFHQVHPIIWRPLIILLSNWSRTFLIIICSSQRHEKVPFFRKMMCLVLPPNFMLQKILICSKESASS